MTNLFPKTEKRVRRIKTELFQDSINFEGREHKIGKGPAFFLQKENETGWTETRRKGRSFSLRRAANSVMLLV